MTIDGAPTIHRRLQTLFAQYRLQACIALQRLRELHDALPLGLPYEAS
jgi:hypothetical protein